MPVLWRTRAARRRDPDGSWPWEPSLCVTAEGARGADDDRASSADPRRPSAVPGAHTRDARLPGREPDTETTDTPGRDPEEGLRRARASTRARAATGFDVGGSSATRGGVEVHPAPHRLLNRARGLEHRRDVLQQGQGAP